MALQTIILAVHTSRILISDGIVVCKTAAIKCFYLRLTVTFASKL